MAEKKLINYGRYNAISITREGEIAAKEIINKHNSLLEFFKFVLGAKEQEAQKNACAIEHIISEDIMQRVIAFTKYYRNNYKDEFKNKFCT